MPRFLHTEDPSLSDLNRAKKQLNRDYKKQYSSQDDLHDNLGETADTDSIYNTLSTRLTGLYTSLNDLYNYFNAPTGLAQFSLQGIGNSNQLGSKVLTEIRAIQVIVGRIKNFNMFTPPQFQQLSTYVQDVNNINNNIKGVLEAYNAVVGAPAERAKVVAMSNVINSFQDELALLLQFLNGATSNYQSTEGVKTGGVAYHYRATTMTGGAIVPAFNGEGVFGSDGYRIGDFYTYSSPRRFY